MPFTATMQKKNKAIVSVDGALTIYVAADAKAQMQAVLAEARSLELDLGNLEEIDTAGVQLLLMFKREALRANKPIVFRNHSPAVRAALDLLNLAAELDDPPHSRAAADSEAH